MEFQLYGFISVIVFFASIMVLYIYPNMKSRRQITIVIMMILSAMVTFGSMIDTYCSNVQKNTESFTVLTNDGKEYILMIIPPYRSTLIPVKNSHGKILYIPTSKIEKIYQK